jgi:hypothetical protein
MFANSGELTRIKLMSLWPAGLHPQRLLGDFDRHGELVFCNASDPNLSWTRQPGESAEDFERRVVGDILAHRGEAVGAARCAR